MTPRTVSLLIVTGGLVALVALTIAALLVTSRDPDIARLGLVIGLVGPIVTALIAALRAEQAQQQTNGSLDVRIASAVTDAIRARRTGDRVVVHESPQRPPATDHPAEAIDSSRSDAGQDPDRLT